MSAEKPIYGTRRIDGTFDPTPTAMPQYNLDAPPLMLSEEDIERLHLHMVAFDVQLQAARQIAHEKLTASKQHTMHKTGMRRFTFAWGDSHVEGVQFSHQSHPGLVAYVNGGIYDFCGSIHVMCAKLNILEADISWIDEVSV